MPKMSPKPVFDGDVITPQTVRSFMPVFSGSMIAYVEAQYDDAAGKPIVQCCAAAQSG